MAAASIKSNQTHAMQSCGGSSCWLTPTPHWFKHQFKSLGSLNASKASGYLFSSLAELTQLAEVVAHSNAPCCRVTIYQELLPGDI